MGLRRTCPLCGAGYGRAVWHEQQHRYVRCGACGTVFSDVDAATYAAAARNAWHDSELESSAETFYGAARELVHRRFLERFTPFGGGRLLDVGCGLGYFVRGAGDLGWDAYGCDTSEPWVGRARALVSQDRIALGEVAAGMLGGRFDLVTAWDVLEHVHDPLPFLAAIATLLAPSGRVFIRTPNLAWIYPTYGLRRSLLGEQVELGPLNHVVYYTSASLTRALRAVGLEPAQWPVLPPPQVGFGNRASGVAGRATAVTRLKNLHAAGADRLGRLTSGRLVLGADLDVVAVRSS